MSESGLRTYFRLAVFSDHLQSKIDAMASRRQRQSSEITERAKKPTTYRPL